MEFLFMVCDSVPTAFRHAAGSTTRISTVLTAGVAEVTVTVPCPLASHNLRWSPSSQNCRGGGSRCNPSPWSQRVHHALTLGSPGDPKCVTQAARKPISPFLLTLSKQFLAGPLTFLKCVADCTFLTGCMRESRTMMLMSAPE